MCVMSCQACGGATELVDSNGGVKEGDFTEKYECVECGAPGWVRGKAGEPAETWKHTGKLFNGEY